MKNAHQRMGRLRYQLSREKRRTLISLCLDRLVANRTDSGHADAHLLSVFGGDAEIAAITAALSDGGSFTIEAPGLDPLRISIKGKPKCFKGAISVPDRNRTLRHLLVLSREWINSATASNPPEIFLLDSSPDFVWTNVAYIYGLPGCPTWAAWFYQKLVAENAISRPVGVGCDPVLVRGSREQFLSWLGEGVAGGVLKFPDENGPILWSKITLRSVLDPQSDVQRLAPDTA